MLLTAKASEIEGSDTLANFPLLVRLNAANHASVFAGAKADGSDLRFTLRNGNSLSYELVSFDAAAQSAQIWVRVPALSKTQNEFYLYYGNLAAGTASSSSVWSNYTAVYHFEQAGATWNASNRATGQIGSSWQYGTNKTVSTNSIVMTQKSWTVSAWVNLDEHGTDFVLQGGPCFFFLAPPGTRSTRMATAPPAASIIAIAAG
jgi:hypothetical protein